MCVYNIGNGIHIHIRHIHVRLKLETFAKDVHMYKVRNTFKKVIAPLNPVHL